VEGMKDGVFSLITTGHICFNSFFNLPALAILSSHDCWWEAVLEQQTKLRNNTFDFSQSKAASLWKWGCLCPGCPVAPEMSTPSPAPWAVYFLIYIFNKPINNTSLYKS
jgi:hypothetical protein